MTTSRTSRLLLIAALFLAASTAVAAPVTDVRLQNTGAAAQTAVPITFGQVFSVGDVKKSDVLTGSMAGAAVPLQVDVKATHADGSVRHAIISAVVPKLPAGTTPLSIATGGTAPTSAANFRDSAANANVTLTIAGVKYTASLADALGATPAPWLAGPIAVETFVDAPLKNAAGAVHPLLTVKYGVRWYPGAKAARVEVVIENTWAYEPNPQNVTYDVSIDVGGKVVYSKQALTHFHHARWHQYFWTGATPAVHVQHNTAYLIASRAVPSYDQSIQFSEATLAGLNKSYAASNTGPMGLGLSMAYMPTTGGRSDIGLMPAWAATYLLTMDKRAKGATVGTAELAGSYSSHYRDKNTGRPLSLSDYPYTSIGDPNDGDTRNPVTGKLEALPKLVAGKSDNPYTWDVAHQPAYAYLPYLVTGDAYFLDELQFWAMANAINGHPGYRDGGKGLVIAEQTRGQAWAVRTLAEAAYITPDADRLKSQFVAILNNNLDWYNANYTNNPAANSLGVLVESIGYMDSKALAPWQDDMFTSAIGHAADLGFVKAEPLLKWKSKFAVSRMVGAGACWIDAAAYNIVVRPSATAPLFSDIGAAYRATQGEATKSLPCNSQAMATAFGLGVGEMTGYSLSTEGYPSNMQPALAYAVDAGIPSAKEAWAKFMARSVKPDYSQGPAFAIVPRLAGAPPPTVTPPVISPPAPTTAGTITTPSSVTVAKKKCLNYRVFVLATLATVSDFACVTPTSANKFTLTATALVSGAEGLAGAVIDPVTGTALAVQYPLTVK